MAFDWKGFLFALVPLLAGAGITKNAVETIAGTSSANGAASSWPVAAGYVSSARIEEGSTAGNRGQSHAIYTLHISYAYEVGGTRYRSDRLSFAQPHQHSTRSAAEDELLAYPVGGPVTVHYDPARPADAVLRIESIGSIIFFLLGLGLLLLLFGFWMLRNVLRPNRAAAIASDLSPMPADNTATPVIDPVPALPLSGAYVPGTNPAPVEVRTSADGTLLVETYEGVWAGEFSWLEGRRGQWFRLVDRASGAVLLDSSAIFEVRWVWPDDGNLLLRVTWELNDVHREDMYRIDPAARTYRNLSNARPDRPLTGLWAEVHAELDRARRNDIDRDGERWASGIKWISRWFSPHGSVRFDLVEWEIVHSWGFIPRVYLTEGNEKVLDLGDWGDRATFTFEGENLLRIDLRNPGNVSLIVHPRDRVGRVAGDSDFSSLSDIGRRVAQV